MICNDVTTPDFYNNALKTGSVRTAEICVPLELIARQFTDTVLLH